MPIGKEGNVKWVDGFRGIASLLVVSTHLTRGWEGELFWAASAEDAPPRLLQLPFLRVFVQGRLGVAIFSFVTGYVCALKPIRLCGQQMHEDAVLAVGKSALRRFPRIFLPVTAATTLSWLMCQLGFFAVARHQESRWIIDGSPEQSKSLGEALYSLLNNIVSTWTVSSNIYDINQWTLLALVRGSVYVYAFMVATANVKPKYRMLASLGVWVYFYCAADPTFGMQFFWGTLLADLQNSEAATDLIARRPIVSHFFSVLCIIVGLFLDSVPEAHAEWVPWSRQLQEVLAVILPGPQPDFARFGTGLGLEFLTLGILLSPGVLQRGLASKFLLFFGRMSFAVYLLHGPLLRTTLVWMLFGVHVPAPHEDPPGSGTMVPSTLTYPGDLTLLAFSVVWLPMVYGLATLWTNYVDAWCDLLANKLASYVKLGDYEKLPALPTTS